MYKLKNNITNEMENKQTKFDKKCQHVDVDCTKKRKNHTI